VTRQIAFGLALLALACSESDGGPKDKDSGPPDPVTLEVFPADFVAENTPLKMLSDGDPIQLIAAPQGGHVIHVAAKVRGMTRDIANLRARIRYPDTNLIQTEEARDVVWKPVPGEPDLMQPDPSSITQVSHIPACPDYETSDIVDQLWKLEVVVTEVDGPGVGSTTIGVVPKCLQTDPADETQCRCECEALYVLGKCNPNADGGS